MSDSEEDTTELSLSEFIDDNMHEIFNHYTEIEEFKLENMIDVYFLCNLSSINLTDFIISLFKSKKFKNWHNVNTERFISENHQNINATFNILQYYCKNMYSIRITSDLFSIWSLFCYKNSCQ